MIVCRCTQYICPRVCGLADNHYTTTEVSSHVTEGPSIRTTGNHTNDDRQSLISCLVPRSAAPWLHGGRGCTGSRRTSTSFTWSSSSWSRGASWPNTAACFPRASTACGAVVTAQVMSHQVRACPRFYCTWFDANHLVRCSLDIRLELQCVCSPLAVLLQRGATGMASTKLILKLILPIGCSARCRRRLAHGSHAEAIVPEQAWTCHVLWLRSMSVRYATCPRFRQTLSA